MNNFHKISIINYVYILEMLNQWLNLKEFQIIERVILDLLIKIMIIKYNIN